MKKWLKRIVLAGLALVLVGWAVTSLLLAHWTAKPPPLPANSQIVKLQKQERDGKTWLGESWVARREGLLTIRLKGGPFEMGYADGALLQPQIHTLENEFIQMVHGYVPHEWMLKLLKSYVIYRNRELSAYVPEDVRLEILGATIGCPDVHPELGDYYNRVLNYHAAHDISYMMIDNPMITHAGCTSFGAWGKAADSGHLITGRNFDWEAAEVFSRDRVVVMYEPAGGIPFISLAWSGMAGVVSGMNRAGISITLNGAPSSLPSNTATPVALVARDILQRAHNFAEALEILRNARVFVSTLWLLGSRADGRFIIIEKTPDTMHVHEPTEDSIVCANHFETTGLKENDRNQSYMREATSVSRENRLNELLRQHYGKLDAARSAEILRDRDLPGSVFAGNGHRAALNAYICTHATVMDLTSGIFWAASPPNQLGKFVAFDVNDFSHELPDKTIADDPALASGDYTRARQAQEAVKAGFHELKEKHAQAALADADKAETLNPGFYQNAFLRGRAFLALGQNSAAGTAFSNAIAAQPAFLKEKEEIEKLLEKSKQ